MKQTYIALDLETTGFEPSTDQVLEIAAIKFQGDQILEKFETLINPGVEIPAMVSHITGISSETVKDAPSFEQVSDNLRLFLGNFPIVGHNIDFDLTFLEAKGIPILNQQIDTLKLANILLPNLPSYSLDTISRQLKISHQQKHRAMSDAHVCFELFQILLGKISEIPAATLQEIQTLIPRTNWELGEFFLNSKSKTPKKFPSKESTTVSNTDISSYLNSTDDLIELLGSASPLKEIIQNYEHRPGQQKLLQKILSTVENHHNLIAEAGTGTGKTMAYLLAAAFVRKKLGKKTTISTYTNNLQDQIISKDFPLIQSLFPDLKLAVLKGRKKYLSLARFNQLKNKPVLEEHELTTIIKVLIWLNQTETGDLDELSLQNKEILLYEEICSDPENLPGSSYNETDFLVKARAKAELSDIVIANHALLIQDSISESHILPPAEILIVDEAHHLEKTVTDALTVTLSLNRLFRQWDKLVSSLEEAKGEKMLFENRLESIQENLKKIRLQSLSLAETVFNQIRLTIEKFAHTLPGQSSTLAIHQSVATSEQWHSALAKIQDLTTIAPELESEMGRLLNLLIEYELDESEMPMIIKNIINFHKNFRDLVGQPENKIVWISKGYDESIHLSYAPLSVKNIFSEHILHHHQSVILTSATLSTLGKFAYIRSELGLDESFEEIRIPSHFSYPDQVKIIIPEDLPEPRDPNYLIDCTKIIESVIRKNGGRTLVLFTAKKDLAKIFHDTASGLKKEGYNLLAQNLSGGRGKIISHFQDEPEKCAILGTNSFWEGVDLVGTILTCVIIQKLPFDPPDDPIVYARSMKFEKPFEEYSLPRAILRFKQGFGRLIRSSRDTGAVIVLDSRLVQKSYGREFISALPEGIKIHQCGKTEVSEHL